VDRAVGNWWRRTLPFGIVSWQSHNHTSDTGEHPMKTTHAAKRTSKVSIVFAENDHLISEVMSELLRSKGYDVHLAQDGLEAIHLIRQITPKFVILDVMMPKLDGGRVCWLVRQDPALRSTPIIVFSSLGTQDFRYFPQLSADAYVAKGPVAEAFQNVMRAIEYLGAKGQPDITGGIFGYDLVQPREIVAEMLAEMRRLASVLQALGAGTMELDREGRILRVSAGACEILGRNESQIVGEIVTSLCQSRDQEALRNLVQELARTSQPERFRAVVRFLDREIPVLLCSIVERGPCTGVFLIMESEGVQVQTQK
jgi:PAS domain S-box-containing protein